MSIALSIRIFPKHVLLRSSFKAITAFSTSSSKSILDFNDIRHPTKVPLKPIASDSIKAEKVTIDRGTIELLMRLSLVNLSDE